MQSGLHYLRHAPTLQAPLIRAFTFTFFVSAVWSLLAIVAKRDLHQGALGYGILNGSLGLGAVAGASTLARLRRRLTPHVLLAITSSYYVVALLVLALVHKPAIIIVALLFSGFCWTCTMSTLNVAVQLTAPGWVQARALGVYLMTFQGGLALGSVLWGAIAQHTSSTTALLCAAAGLAATLPFTLRIPILQGAVPDLSPYQSKRPVPLLAEAPDPEDGPVRISIDYTIPAHNYAAFTHVVHELEGVRLRVGAVRWGIYRDAADPTHLNETFIMESWLDFLRSRERMTAADNAIREHVWALHEAPEPPKVTHQIYVREITPQLTALAHS